MDTGRNEGQGAAGLVTCKDQPAVVRVPKVETGREYILGVEDYVLESQSEEERGQ